MEIGNKIKEYRLKRGWTQEQLGDLLNVSRSTISSWEVGRNYPDIKTLIELSHLFDMTVDGFLKGDEEMVKAIDFNRKEKRLFKLGMVIMAVFSLMLSLFIIVNQTNQPQITFEKEKVEKGWENNSAPDLFDRDEIKEVKIGKNNQVTITFNTPFDTSYEGHMSGGGSGIASIALCKKKEANTSSLKYEWTTQIDLSELPKIKELTILVK